MRFTKMHGLGNDYVYVNTFDQALPRDPRQTAIAVSDRHFGIGGDGLILIMPSERADARMRMFNADGSEGEMCGNGIRCVAKYLYDHGLARRPRVTIETERGILTLDLKIEAGAVERVRVDMGRPVLAADQIPTRLAGNPPIDAEIEIDGRALAVTAVSMGNPHAVIHVDDVAGFPLEARRAQARASCHVPPTCERAHRRRPGQGRSSNARPGSAGWGSPSRAAPARARSASREC